MVLKDIMELANRKLYIFKPPNVFLNIFVPEYIESVEFTESNENIKLFLSLIVGITFTSIKYKSLKLITLLPAS